MHDLDLIRITRIDADRLVAQVRYGDIFIRCLWIVDARSKPRISWPQTARGFNMIEAEPELRSRIDGMLLAAVGAPTKPPKKPRKRRRRSTAPSTVSHAGDPNDTLEDLFIGGLA